MKKIAIVAVLVAAVIFGIVAYASAATTDTQTVTVNATANPKLTLTVDRATVNFGAVDPETPTGPETVVVTVKSNKTYNLTKVIAGDVALMGLSTTLADHAAKDLPRGTRTYNDDYSINIPYTTDGGTPLSATVQYTAAQ